MTAPRSALETNAGAYSLHQRRMSYRPEWAQALRLARVCPSSGAHNIRQATWSPPPQPLSARCLQLTASALTCSDSYRAALQAQSDEARACKSVQGCAARSRHLQS